MQQGDTDRGRKDRGGGLKSEAVCLSDMFFLNSVSNLNSISNCPVFWKNGAKSVHKYIKNGANDVSYQLEVLLMYRKDSITVKEWLEHSDKALLVTGAYVKIGLTQEKPYKTRV